MGQQHGAVDGVVEHVPRRSAQDDLAEAAVTVTAHDQQAGFHFDGCRGQRLTDRPSLPLDRQD